MQYVAKLIPESTGGYSAEFPDVPGCRTRGDTQDEALAMAKDALERTLEDYLEDGLLPSPDTDENESEGLYTVEVDEEVARRLIEAYKSNAIKTLMQLDNIGFFEGGRHGTR